MSDVGLNISPLRILLRILRNKLGAKTFEPENIIDILKNINVDIPQNENVNILSNNNNQASVPVKIHLNKESNQIFNSDTANENLSTTNNDIDIPTKIKDVDIPQKYKCQHASK